MWFRNLPNWFVAIFWKDLNMWTKKALKYCKQSPLKVLLRALNNRMVIGMQTVKASLRFCWKEGLLKIGLEMMCVTLWQENCLQFVHILKSINTDVNC